MYIRSVVAVHPEFRRWECAMHLQSTLYRAYSPYQGILYLYFLNTAAVLHFGLGMLKNPKLQCRFFFLDCNTFFYHVYRNQTLLEIFVKNVS